MRRSAAPPPPAPAAEWSDLPLFPEARSLEPIVPEGRARVRRPLAVRRRAPRVRARPAPAPRPARQAEAAPAAPAHDVGGPAPASTPGRAPQPAPPGRRIVAGLADLLFLALVDAVVVALTARLLGAPLPAAASALPWLPLAGFLVLFNLASVVALTALGGQTLGKMAAGVRVVRRDGGPVPVRRALARALLSVLSALPAGLGFLGLLAGSRRACHDWLAGTCVVAAARS